MAVLTKPDLAIESTMKNIAIQHVLGKRGDLSLGYYIVKNRGPDAADMTLKQGQEEERRFFATEPWSVLRSTGRAGIMALKTRVRELLVDLIKKEFPKLKADIVKESTSLKSQLDKMGQSRSNSHTQRAYLNKISEAFQTLSRDALNAYYISNEIFERHDLRLITRIVKATEKYSETMSTEGHTRPFESDSESDESDETKHADPDPDKEELDCLDLEAFLDLEDMFDPVDLHMPTIGDEGNIIDYIQEVHEQSRGQELGTVSHLQCGAERAFRLTSNCNSSTVLS